MLEGRLHIMEAVAVVVIGYRKGNGLLFRLCRFEKL